MGLGNKRNKLCSCQSGQKYKNCCMKKEKILELMKVFNDGHSPLKLLNFMETPDWIDPSHSQYGYAITLASICSRSEVEKILECKDAKSYLLKLRADSISDNMRIYRTMLNHKKGNETSWSLEQFFESNDFKRYIELLNSGNRKRCSELTVGYAFTSEPNGMVMSTEHGKVMMISHSLKYFLYFMNLANVDYDIEVPHEVRLNALRIAIRLILQTESLDIEIDPRGEVPRELDELIWNSVDSQLQFVIGHEYSHFLFDHLDEKRLSIRPLMESEDSDYINEYKFYNKSQKQEFEADLGSIELLQCSEFEKEHHIFSAIQFFMYLAIYQHAREIIFPIRNRYNTHPLAEERIDNLVNNYKGELLFVDSNLLKEVSERITDWKGFLNEDIGFNFESYENYGSIYLDPWHKKILRDRIDY